MVSRPCRRRRPSSLDDGGISGLFSSGGPSVRFLTRYDGEVSEPLLRRCSGKGLHLAMTGEPRGFSRVTTGNSGCLLCWPREVQSSIRVGKESWGLLSSDCRANRPHLGLGPEANAPLQGRHGSRGCIPDASGETGIHLEWKQRTPLCPRVATGISWSSQSGRKGVKPPEAFGDRSGDWSLGHAGDEALISQ